MSGGTERHTIGLGLIPIPLRNVAVLAMELAFSQRMFPSRLRVRVGQGVQNWMGQTGYRVTSRLTPGQESITALSSLLEVTAVYRLCVCRSPGIKGRFSTLLIR